MPSRLTIDDVAVALEDRYPVRLAADWDAIGLVAGDPDSGVRSVLFAVDPVQQVVEEALALGVDLIVTHHPLFLRGVHSVAPTTAGGRVVHTLVSNGIGLYVAHTNADAAMDGVSDALAAALGVVATRPLVPSDLDPTLGTGRVGELAEPVTLADFAVRVAQALPETARGVQVAGHPDLRISTVAVCGGSGDEYLADAAGIADVYVTSDLRHHRALDHRAAGGCALVDVAHWAGEWPWLPVAAGLLSRDLAALGVTVEVHVSTIPTDPWTSHVDNDQPLGGRR